MALNNIVEKLTSFIKNRMSLPLTAIPGFLLVCSTLKRPGLSPMLITARVINRQQEFGAPIGVNIDGSPNMMNQMFHILIDEMVKALKMEGKVEVAIPPGAITSVGFGANAGGLVQVTSNSVGTPTLQGIIR
jgi:hypothetical protein